MESKHIKYLNINFLTNEKIVLNLFLALIFYAPLLFSQQQVSFRQLSVKDGLSQNSAISIVQDSIGYLWVATQDGINKYDGRKFTSYPHQFIDITRPNYSHLGKLYIDRQNQLWAIPITKIPLKLNTKTNSFDPLAGVTNAYTIFQDNTLNYWITTYSKEVLFIEAKSNAISKLPFDQPLSGMVNHITEIDKNTLLLLGKNELIEVDIQSKKSTLITPKTEQGDSIKGNFSTMVIDAAGKQWLGSFNNGLYLKEKGSAILKRLPIHNFKGVLPININILDLLLDSKNRLWIATYGKGLYMVDFNAKKINHFSNKKHNPRTIQYNDVLCIYEDYLGTLWFGTDGAGLSYYDEYLEKFNSYTNDQTPENINIDVVRAIAVDTTNTIWAGTSGKGLSRFDPKKNVWKTFSTENSKLHSNRIMSLLVNNGELWIGSQGEGLSILDANGTYATYTQSTSISLSAKTIWDIYKDKRGKVWLATNENGLIQFDKKLGEIKKYSHSNLDKLPGNNVRVLTEDKNGNLWLGTDNNGIFKFNISTESFSKHPIFAKDSITVNAIKSLFYDDNDILWIGTFGQGLIAFDIANHKTYAYNTDNGLANDVIYAILPDTNANLWLSSNKGITKFTPNKSWAKHPEITNYNNYDGLATEFNTGAYFKGTNGSLYFGGLDGLYWFQPKNIKKNTILPRTTMTGFQVLNKEHSMVNGMQLENNQNTLAFTFSSLQFSLPEKNYYQYRLINHDKEWVFSENKNYARYTQLPPGDYEFQVKSSNYDGYWNIKPETFTFSIKNPWYATHLAKFIYFIVVCSLLFGIFLYVKWRWRMKLNLKLKEEETHRLKKLSDYRSTLYTDIAHEFKTPLTLISGPIDQKLSQGNLSDFDHTNFSMVKRNTHRLTSLVDQLLELAKLEDNTLKLKVTQGNLTLFLHAIARSFEYQSSVKNINYSIETRGLDHVWYDEDVLEKITSNLLSNAFKYTSKNGNCRFLAIRKDNQVHIEVKNTAINASKLQLDKLFTRFYQYDNSSEGIGVGLALVKELTKIYGGNIKATLEEENLLNFTIELPIDKASFSEESIIIPKTLNQNITALLEENQDNSSSSTTKKSLPILLIVEDHQEVRTFIKLALQSNYQILEAENGKIGVEIALNKVPDIILSDVRMPILNGIDLCNTLKTDERTSHIPIILLTARVGEENELKGLTSGADDFMSKPFKITLLKQRMANLIHIRKALRNRYSEEFILKPKDITITPSDEIFLNKIQQILDENLTDPSFNAAAFSKKAKMSRMQLHRKLQAYTGLSTTAFLRSQRLKQALRLLKSSNLTINEIAYTVGFNTPSYFIKCFKETFKKTPSEYYK